MNLEEIYIKINSIEKMLQGQEKDIQKLKQEIYKQQSYSERQTDNSTNKSDSQKSYEIKDIDQSLRTINNTKIEDKSDEMQKNPMPIENKKVENLEFKIGGTWINRIGIIAIIFALSYFLKYTFDNNLIGPVARVIIGTIFGVGFLFAGNYYSKKYISLAQGFTGGGIACLYFSTFAAFNFYNLINQSTAFMLLAIITAGGILISVRYNAKAIMLLGMLTGFLTPFLISSQHPNDMGFLVYIGILDIGILTVTFLKEWKVFQYVGYIATLLVFGIWYLDRFIVYDNANRIIQFWLAETFLTVLFFISIGFLIFYSINKKTFSSVDSLFVIGITFFYYLPSYNTINEAYGKTLLGLFTVIVSILYFGVSYLLKVRHNTTNLPSIIFLGLAVVLLIIAVPIQFNGKWITLSWATEGILLLYTSFKFNKHLLRKFSIISLLLVAGRLLFVDIPSLHETQKAFFNMDSLIYLVCIIVLFISVFIYKVNQNNNIGENEKYIPILTAIVSNGLLIFLILANTSMLFNNIEISKNYALDITNSKQLTYSGILVVYSLITILIGIMKKQKYLRIFSFVLFLISIFKVFLFDLSILEGIYRILSFVILGFILLGVSYMYQKFKNIILE